MELDGKICIANKEKLIQFSGIYTNLTDKIGVLAAFSQTTFKTLAFLKACKTWE